MSKAYRIIRVGLLVLFLLAAGFAAGYYFLWLKPFQLAENTMAEHVRFTLTLQDDGSTLLEWTGAENADGYSVEIAEPDNRELVLSVQRTENPALVLPAFAAERTFAVTVNTEKIFRRLGRDEIRPGERPVSLVCDLAAPVTSELTAAPDPEQKSALISWQSSSPENLVRLTAVRGAERTDLGVIVSGERKVSFTEGGELAMPSPDDVYTFEAVCYREGDDYVYYGNSVSGATVVREDLLGRNLNLEMTDGGYNHFTLRWDETKGDHYLVEMRDMAPESEWTPVAEIDRTGERRFEIRGMEPFTERDYRVSAVGGDTLPGSEYAAEPVAKHVSAVQCVEFATVWPIKDLKLYDTPERVNEIGEIKAASCCCVIAEEGDAFLVRCGEQTGYVESFSCLINLPDYIGDLAAYDITNSYASLYMIHDFNIPLVTNTVIAGYEHVRLPDGSFLVPLIYPVAQKFLNAALTARADGYRFRIFDAYRPNQATQSIYYRSCLILDDPLPDRTFYGDPAEWMDLPEPEVEVDENGEEIEKELTYRNLVENGVYNMSYFLAAGASYHNAGIALDMTIESLDGAQEMKMQTAMHDLSWYSVLSRNTAAANLLYSYMTGAGFAGLTSEWWHFQDNVSRDTYNLRTFMWPGVTPEGWAADENGWRYRDIDGNYCADTTLTLGESVYRFDAQGYLAEN